MLREAPGQTVRGPVRSPVIATEEDARPVSWERCHRRALPRIL